MSPNFFSVQICPSKSDADSELISDRKGNSEIASRMRAAFLHTFKNPSPLSLLASRVDKYYVSHNPLNTSLESFGHRPPIAAWPTLCLDHPVPLECLLGDYRASIAVGGWRRPGGGGYEESGGVGEWCVSC
jgi:hypothetical protein